MESINFKSKQKKKVLIATNSLEIGGVETNIIELSTGLKRSDLYDPIIVSNGGKLVKTLKNQEIKHYKVHLNNKNPLYYFPTILKLKKIIKEEQIDLIHSHARIPSIICNILARKYKIPFITSVHYPFRLNFIYKKFSKWGNKTIAVSEDLKEYVLKNYDIKNKDVSVVINGIDTNKFDDQTPYDDIVLKYNLQKNANRLVHISRLDKTTSKTVDILLDIFEDLNKKIPNLELIIVGSGTEFNRLYKKANIINKILNRTAIIFTGNISEDVNKFTSLATLFIGVSRSALEAMSSRKPVILSGNQGYLGLFTQEHLNSAIKTNFCCRNGKSVNNTILKNDIINFFTNYNADEIKKIGEYNRNIIVNYYSQQIMINNTIDIYNEFLNNIDKEKSLKNIVISGAYGRTNSGDESILFSIIKQLKEINKDINITALSLNPQKTSKDYNINSIYTFDIFKIKKALKKCDIFISGGGTLLQNITSTRSILYYLYIIKKAKKYNCKVVMYGCGVGPINGNLIRKKTSKILNTYVDDILLRDSLSYKELTNLNVNLSKSKVGIDPSFLLNNYIKTDENILDKLNLDSSKKYVGICIKKDTHKIISAMSEVIKFLHNNGMTCVLIPINHKEDLSILKELHKRTNVPIHIIDNNISFVSKYSLISKMDLVIGMRLHSIIFAYLSNVKTIGISYDPKVDSFCKDYGIHNLININEFTYDRFINEFNKLNLTKIDNKKIEDLNKNNIELLKKYLL